jgi:dTDP-4-dehydrorhamnose 3,5-epimerase
MFEKTPLPSLFLLCGEPRKDTRGLFERLYCDRELGEIGALPIVQVNRSVSLKKGTVRGLHYQLPPHCEQKVVRCVKGAIFDLAVDLRKNSPTFLKWYGVELNEEVSRALFIPEGFAHGFQTLTDHVEMLYLHSRHYASEFERGVRWDDPRVGIRWPLPPQDLSIRDGGFEPLSEDFLGIEVNQK